MNIVDVPEKMQKFYGSGKMLHPDVAMVEELVRMIPNGKVVLIDSICEKLATDHGTDVTCPMRTGGAVKKIIETYALEEDQSIPFWRVIRKNHMLVNSSFTEICAANLRKEGFQVEEKAKGEFRVAGVEEMLFEFSE
ncbi:MAG: MGMT family protein [Cyclobacteriaceae bacterium]